MLLIQFTIVLAILSVSYTYIVQEQSKRHTKNEENKLMEFLNNVKANTNKKIDELYKNIERRDDQRTIPDLDDIHALKVNLFGESHSKNETWILNSTVYRDIFSKISNLNKYTYEKWEELNEKQVKHKNNVQKVLNDKLGENAIKTQMEELLQKNSNKIEKITTIITSAYNDEQRVRHHMLECKMLVVIGDNYTQGFKIEVNSLNSVKVKQDQKGLLTYFRMLIAMKGPRDGVFRLSESPDANKPKEFYLEIVIGGTNNTVSLIRDSQEQIVRDRNYSTIIFPTVYTEFFIEIDDGTLKVFKDGNMDSVPFLSCTDEKLNRIKYYSFNSCEEAKVTFLYDC